MERIWESIDPNWSFLQKFTHVMKDPAEALEGGLWGGFLSILTFDLAKAVYKRRELDHLPNSAIKTNKIWNRNKDIVVSSSSFLSMSAVMAGWMHGVKILSLGILAPFVTGIGFGGKLVVSISELMNDGKRLYADICEGSVVKSASGLREVRQKQIIAVLRVAYSLSFIAWGVFGISQCLIGGGVLLSLVDKCFFFAIILYISRVTLNTLFTLARKGRPLESGV